MIAGGGPHEPNFPEVRFEEHEIYTPDQTDIYETYLSELGEAREELDEAMKEYAVMDAPVVIDGMPTTADVLWVPDEGHLFYPPGDMAHAIESKASIAILRQQAPTELDNTDEDDDTEEIPNYDYLVMTRATVIDDFSRSEQFSVFFLDEEGRIGAVAGDIDRLPAGIEDTLLPMPEMFVDFEDLDKPVFCIDSHDIWPILGGEHHASGLPRNPAQSLSNVMTILEIVERVHAGLTYHVIDEDFEEDDDDGDEGANA